MKIHHLNCATMCPVGGRLISGKRGQKAEFVCHCLLIESESGLILVDTGLGTEDIAQSNSRLSRPFLGVIRPILDPTETALRHVQRLGFSPDDVRHIVLTHMDVDHAGGLPDFPKAKVHLYAPEHGAAMSRSTRGEQERYLPAHWEHQPNFQLYQPQGEPWFGFDAVRQLDSVPPEVLLIPLVGHSRGHCAVAVDTSNGWLLHCGDAYFFRGEIATPPHCPWGLRLFERVINIFPLARLHNQQRLRSLAQQHSDEVQIFCAHDPFELETCRANQG